MEYLDKRLLQYNEKNPVAPIVEYDLISGEATNGNFVLRVVFYLTAPNLDTAYKEIHSCFCCECKKTISITDKFEYKIDC